MPLSDTQIKKAKAAEKPVRLYYERGLYLEVRATSAGAAAKWWRLKYRIGGKEKLLSLGTYLDTSLADARAERDAARELVAKGVDPSQARKDDKTGQAAARLPIQADAVRTGGARERRQHSASCCRSHGLPMPPR